MFHPRKVRASTASYVVVSFVLKLPLIGHGDKTFQRENFDVVSVSEVGLETPAHVKTSEFPAFTAQHQICLSEAVGADGIGETDHFERNFLLCCSGNLLPFERDKVFMAVLLGNYIDEVSATGKTHTDELLSAIGVAAAPQ